MALKKLHKRCEQCKNKNVCDTKRMAACAYLAPPIQSNIPENTSLEEDINRQLEGQIAKKLNSIFCFNELRRSEING